MICEINCSHKAETLGGELQGKEIAFFFFTLISSRVVPSSSACDDSSLSLVCSSPPCMKEKHDLNFVLSEVSHVHSLHCKRTESGKLSKFRQSQLTPNQVKYKNTVIAKSFERR